MNSINKIGLKISLIILLSAIVLFTLWKVAALGMSWIQELRVENITPTQPSTTRSPSPTPNLEESLTTITQTAKETLIGYTKKYVDSLPVDSTKEQVLDQKALEAFVDANRGPLLPELPTGTIQTTSAAGKKAIQTYLDSISPVQNKEIATVTGDMITEALAKQQSNEELQAIVPIRASIEKNLEIFKSIKTPKESLELHTKLIQATQSLLSSIKLLQEMRNDLVGGLIGQKNLADLNGVFTEISNNILALESKYDIK